MVANRGAHRHAWLVCGRLDVKRAGVLPCPPNVRQTSQRETNAEKGGKGKRGVASIRAGSSNTTHGRVRRETHRIGAGSCRPVLSSLDYSFAEGGYCVRGQGDGLMPETRRRVGH